VADVKRWVEKHLHGYVRMSIEDRRQAVKELAAEGESTRAIAEVLGTSKSGVARDLAVPNGRLLPVLLRVCLGPEVT
jgi:hypothetical protein